MCKKLSQLKLRHRLGQIYKIFFRPPKALGNCSLETSASLFQWIVVTRYAINNINLALKMLLYPKYKILIPIFTQLDFIGLFSKFHYYGARNE
jgi:hypothetical protein